MTYSPYGMRKSDYPIKARIKAELEAAFGPGRTKYNNGRYLFYPHNTDWHLLGYYRNEGHYEFKAYRNGKISERLDYPSTVIVSVVDLERPSE